MFDAAGVQGQESINLQDNYIVWNIIWHCTDQNSDLAALKYEFNSCHCPLIFHDIIAFVALNFLSTFVKTPNISNTVEKKCEMCGIKWF